MRGQLRVTSRVEAGPAIPKESAMKTLRFRLFRTLSCALLLAALLPLPASAAEAGAVAEPGPGQAAATFAGGCFWCMEPPFDALDGVVATISGYTGGAVENPDYEQVSAGGTGHAEAVRVIYDPRKISYERLLEVFWHNIDPLTADRQFCDGGTQYRSAIFVHDDTQAAAAEASRDALAGSGRLPGPIVTGIEPVGRFYPAEDYHQDYYVKNPVRYRFYRFNCGRDERLRELWGNAAAH
jgi:peptide-methionine (S)-S-oxide reductase